MLDNELQWEQEFRGGGESDARAKRRKHADAEMQENDAKRSNRTGLEKGKNQRERGRTDERREMLLTTSQL